MASTKTERVPIMFDKQLVEQIDNYSYDNRIRTRSEAIRQLVVKSLKSVEMGKEGKATA